MYYEMNHPLVKHKLTVLRNVATHYKQFRELASELTLLMAYDAMKNLETTTIKVNTPFADTVGCKVNNDIIIIPILPAGMGMLEGMLKIVPNGRVGLLEAEERIKGDETGTAVGGAQDNKELIVTSEKLPQDMRNPHFFVINPMLTDGGSTIPVLSALKQKGFGLITSISLLSAPEGIKNMEIAHPDVDIYTCSIDECLDENNNIIPGIGDAADRIFGII